MESFVVTPIARHRFFVSHSKDLTDAALEVLRDALQHKLALVSREPFTITLARDDYNANFDRCGGWEEWIDDVVNGVHFSTREKRYTGFISAGRILGKASAQMLRLALERRAPVVVFEYGVGGFSNDWTLTPATRVTQVEAHNFKSGWWID